MIGAILAAGLAMVLTPVVVHLLTLAWHYWREVFTQVGLMYDWDERDETT